MWRSAKDYVESLGVTRHILLSLRNSLDSRIRSALYVLLLDVNECAAGNACPAGICVNTQGSYTCHNCMPGFGLSANGLRCEGRKQTKYTFDLSAYIWWLFYFCFETWMSVLRVTFVLVVCAPTRRDHTLVPNVRLDTGSLKTGRGVTVSSSCRPHSVKSVSDCQDSWNPSQCILLNSVLPTSYYIFIVICLHELVCMCFTDIDECQSLSTCANGICLNSDGSYTCENCPTGYRVSYDGELCEG